MRVRMHLRRRQVSSMMNLASHSSHLNVRVRKKMLLDGNILVEIYYSANRNFRFKKSIRYEWHKLSVWDKAIPLDLWLGLEVGIGSCMVDFWCVHQCNWHSNQLPWVNSSSRDRKCDWKKHCIPRTWTVDRLFGTVCGTWEFKMVSYF